MQTTRRAILKLVGGAAAGFVLSPMPWKLLDDASIWTQNWSLIPKLARGPVSFAATACTLCTAGCPVRARDVAGNTVSLGRISGPSFGAPLCLFGLTGHHMAFAPSRLKHAAMRKNGERAFRPASPSEMYDEIADVLRHAHEGSAVFLTGRPASAYIEQIRSLNVFTVRTPSHYDGSFFDMQSAVIPLDEARYGLDPSRLRSVLSIGASLAEGWGISASLIPQFRDRRADIQVIHAGPHQSPTAAMANTWLPLAPGSYASVVRSLCHVLQRDGARPRTRAERGIARSFSDARPDLVAARTGIAASEIEATAHTLRTHTPSIAIADDVADLEVQKAVWRLNVLLGAFDADGCMTPRRSSLAFPDAPRFAPIDQLSDHSIRLLFIDATVTSAMLPQTALEKLISTENALVVRFSPYMDELSERSDIVISTPAPYESMSEVQHPSSADRASFGLSIPLWEMPATSVSIPNAMMDIVAAAGLPTTGLKGDVALLRGRSDRIFRLGRGNVFDRETGAWTGMSDVTSEATFWELLTKGGTWVDERDHRNAPPRIVFTLPNEKDVRIETPLARLAHGDPLPRSTPDSGMSAMFGVVSPLLSKVHQESAHGANGRSVVVHPETAASLGVKSGDASVCEVNGATRTVVVRTSRAVLPGIIVTAQGVQGLPDATSNEGSAS